MDIHNQLKLAFEDYKKEISMIKQKKHIFLHKSLLYILFVIFAIGLVWDFIEGFSAEIPRCLISTFIAYGLIFFFAIWFDKIQRSEMVKYAFKNRNKELFPPKKSTMSWATPYFKNHKLDILYTKLQDFKLLNGNHTDKQLVKNYITLLNEKIPELKKMDNLIKLSIPVIGFITVFYNVYIPRLVEKQSVEINDMILFIIALAMSILFILSLSYLPKIFEKRRNHTFKKEIELRENLLLIQYSIELKYINQISDKNIV